MRRATLAALTVAAAAGIHPAAAQEEEEDLRPALLTATISQSAAIDTNYDLDELAGRLAAIAPALAAPSDTRTNVSTRGEILMAWKIALLWCGPAFRGRRPQAMRPRQSGRGRS